MTVIGYVVLKWDRGMADIAEEVNSVRYTVFFPTIDEAAQYAAQWNHGAPNIRYTIAEVREIENDGE